MSFAWQKALWDDLVRLYKADKVPHAILLAGPRHSGLETLAGSYMQLLMCTSPSDDLACGNCRSCTLYCSGTHPDGFRLGVLEDKKEIVIDQVRQLIHQLSLSSIAAGRKVALIYPAEAMNRNSQNAVLKTLEEPIGSAVIILVSNDPGHLLPTIRSRCRMFSQPLPAKKDGLAWLAENHPGTEQKSLEAAWSAAGGLPLLALRYLEDGTLEQRRAVAKILFQLARSGGNSLQAAQSFKDFPKPDLWLWISGWMGALAKTLLGGEEPEDKMVEAFCNILPRLTAKKALELQRQALRSYQMHDGPVREDLLLADWLIQWQSSR